jgi:hypothetical protein
LISPESDATLRLPRVSVCKLPRGGQRVALSAGGFAIPNAGSVLYITVHHGEHTMESASVHELPIKTTNLLLPGGQMCKQ